MTEERHKKFNIFIFLFPFIDLITSINIRNMHMSITLGMIVKSLMIIYFMWYVFFVTGSKYKKMTHRYLLLLVLFNILYFVFKPGLLTHRFILKELSYILKFSFLPVVFSGLLCFYDDSGLDEKGFDKLMLANMITYGLLLLIPLITGTAFGTYTAGRGGFQGWFYSGNEVSAVIVLLFPFIYKLIDKYKAYIFILIIPIIFAISRIGTKVTFFGLVIVGVIELIKKIHLEKKFDKKVVAYLLTLICIFGFMYNGYVLKNMHETISEQERQEMAYLKEKHERTNPNSKLTGLAKALLSDRDVYILNLNDIYTKNLSASHVLFGLGYSNTKDINDKTIPKLAEIDIIDIFYHMGVVACLLIIAPFIWLFVKLIKYVIKNKLNSDLTVNTLILLLSLAISSSGGHILLDPAVSVYVAFYMIILCNEIGLFDKRNLIDNKVDIFVLHLGYGGIERASISLANILSSKYDVELISLYKTVDEIPYKLNKNIKVKYITDDKPQKEEFIKALKHLNIIKVFKYGINSVVLLHKKKYAVANEISYSDAKYGISTRFDFTKLLNAKGRVDAYKIAVDHEYDVAIKDVFKIRRNTYNIDVYAMASKRASEIYKTVMVDRNIIYIPNSVDDTYNVKSKLNTKNLIYVGRLSEEKGVLDLIDVFNIIHKKDSKVTLDIFGDGKLKGDMEKMIGEYNLGKSVTMHGFKDAKEIGKYYKNASLFVMCSYRESFGIVLIEAMKCGVPCIAFDSATGARDIIEDGKNGYLINNRDKDAMANKVIEYLNIKDKKDIQREALKTADIYSIENIKTIWFNVVKELDNDEKKENKKNK